MVPGVSRLGLREAQNFRLVQQVRRGHLKQIGVCVLGCVQVNKCFACDCVRVCIRVCACRGQSLTLGVFLSLMF